MAAYPSPPTEPQSSGTVVGDAHKNAPPNSSFGSTATAALDGLLTTSPHDTNDPQVEDDGDMDRPPDIDHNDIFGTSSTPPPQPNIHLSQLSPISGLKPLSNPTQETQVLSFDDSIPSPPEISHVATSPSQKANSKLKTKELGPLLPDDFREAIRRVRRDGDFGEIGQSGLSLMGIGLQGTFAAGRGKGRRLFSRQPRETLAALPLSPVRLCFTIVHTKLGRLFIVSSVKMHIIRLETCKLAGHCYEFSIN